MGDDEPLRGRYLAGEVGLLAGVSGDRIGQWARWGHIRSSHSAGDGTDWPLQSNATRLGAANGSVVEFLGDQAYDLGGPSLDEQGVLDVADLRRIHGCLQRGGWAARMHPGLRHIEVHPALLGGRPAIRGRRIAAQEVAELAAQDRGVLHVDYGLDDEQIDDAVLWWETASGFEG